MGLRDSASQLASDRIKASNWIKPLVATYEGKIISGHRRWRAATTLGLATVPVEYREFATETDELEALLLENEFRDKTTEQSYNEGEVWEEVYAEHNRLAQVAAAHQTNAQLGRSADETLTPNSEQAFEDRNERTTVARAAKKVGMKRDTYVKTGRVVKEIRRRTAAGDTRTAEALRSALNTQSVDAAHKMLKLDETTLAAASELVLQDTPVKLAIRAANKAGFVISHP